MAYIGSIPAYQASGVRPRDEFTADGTQICFPLSQSVPGSFESGVTIVLDNVPQQPVEAFTVVDTRTLTLTSISGTFTVNETVTGATSAATGVVLKVNLNNIVIRGLTGTFSSSENITGGTSAATATTTSVTINTGSGILFSEAPTAASSIYVVHEGNATYNLVPTAASVGPSQLSDNLRNFTVDTFTGDGTTTTFTLSDTPSSANSLLVMVDGIVQTRTTNYTLSGAVVTFTDAPDSSAAITIIHLGFSTISRTGLVDGSVTTAKIADANVTSGKLASGAAVSNIGYTPVNKAGDTITGALTANGGVVINEIGADVDFRVEGDTDANLLFIDASTDRVGVGTSSPATKTEISGTAAAQNLALRITNTATDGYSTLQLGGSGDGGIYRNGSTQTAYGGASSLNLITTGSHAIGLATGNTIRAIIPAAGGVQAVTTISVGNATPSASGAGITFPATQSASSNANTLDDYEEGTWTPSVGGSATYGAQQNGWYVKVGSLVTVACDMTIATIGTGNTQLIGGLPFSANSGGVTNGGGAVSYWANLSTGIYSIATQLSGTNIAFVTTTGSQSTVNNTPAVLTSGTRIITTISYLTSS